MASALVYPQESTHLIRGEGQSFELNEVHSLTLRPPAQDYGRWVDPPKEEDEGAPAQEAVAAA